LGGFLGCRWWRCSGQHRRAGDRGDEARARMAEVRARHWLRVTARRRPAAEMNTARVRPTKISASTCGIRSHGLTLVLGLEGSPMKLAGLAAP